MNLLPANWLFVAIVIVSILSLATYLSRNYEISEITPSPPWVKLIRKSISDKKKVSMVQFTIDETETIYKAFHFEPSRGIMHQRVGISLPAGREYDEARKRIAISDEADDKLEKETNHYLFGWLEGVGYNPKKVPIVIEEKHDSSARKIKNKEFLFPIFFITLQNDNSKQIVANKISLKIYKVIPVSGFAESARLDSVATYKISIDPEIGVYQQQMVPPIKIAPHDAISFKLRVLPKSDDGELSKGGVILIADVSIHWEVGTTTSPRFMLAW